mmetsp:Transcript_27949/g.66390  ORF Transcript_27949/g.66390 Transcript_27949/m.66390 type:complete len:318 (+) Transcript_27949:1556-2509(+)
MSPTLTAELGTSTTSGTDPFPPMSISIRTCDGMSSASDRRSPVARARARASRFRPRSTTASSMTGSSRNAELEVTPGSAAVATPPRKEVVAPRLTREFMFGEPAASILKPSTSSPLPGPSSAAAPRAACTGALPRADMTGPWARPWAPAACSRCPAWCTQQTAARPHATARPAPASALPSSPPPPARLIGRPTGLTVVANPFAVTAAAAASATADRSSPASPSTSTAAMLVRRLTEAALTPGCCSRIRLTAAEQPPHFIPSTSRRTAPAFSPFTTSSCTSFRAGTVSVVAARSRWSHSRRTAARSPMGAQTAGEGAP